MKKKNLFYSKMSTLKLFYLLLKSKFKFNEKNVGEVNTKVKILSDIVKEIKSRRFGYNLVSGFYERSLRKVVVQDNSFPQLDRDYAHLNFEKGELEVALDYYQKAAVKSKCIVDLNDERLKDMNDELKVVLGNAITMSSVINFQMGEVEKAINGWKQSLDVIKTYELLKIDSAFDSIYRNSVRLLVTELFLWGKLDEVKKLYDLIKNDTQLNYINTFIDEYPDYQLITNSNINEYCGKTIKKINLSENFTQARKIKINIKNGYVHEKFYSDFRELIDKIIEKVNNFKNQLESKMNNIPKDVEIKSDVYEMKELNENFNKFLKLFDQVIKLNLEQYILQCQITIGELNEFKKVLYKIPFTYTIKFFLLSFKRYFIKIFISVVLLGTVVQSIISNYSNGIIFGIILSLILWLIDTLFIDKKIETYFLPKVKVLLLKLLFNFRISICEKYTRLIKLNDINFPTKLD